MNPKYQDATPGPWRVERVGNKSFRILEFTDASPLSERNANARLIADAPRLAEENERLREALSNLTLESLHYIEHGFGKTHLRDSIARAETALTETEGAVS